MVECVLCRSKRIVEVEIDVSMRGDSTSADMQPAYSVVCTHIHSFGIATLSTRG